MKNTKYCVTGTAFTAFDNATAVSAVTTQGFITPYQLQQGNVKVTIGNPDVAADPNLANVIIYATDEPDTTYTGNTTFDFTLSEISSKRRVDSDPVLYAALSVWSLSVNIVSSSNSTTGLYFKLKDARNWQSVPFTGIGTTTQLLNEYRFYPTRGDNGRRSVWSDFLVLEVYRAADNVLLRTWDVQKRVTINTNTDYVNVTPTSIPVVTSINPESAYKDAAVTVPKTGTTPSVTTGTSTISFTVVITA